MKYRTNRIKKKKLYIGGGRQPIELRDYGNYDIGDISSIYEIDRDQTSEINKIREMLKIKGITSKRLINIEGGPEEPNVNEFYILDDEDEIIKMLDNNREKLKFINVKDEIWEEIKKMVWWPEEFDDDDLSMIGIPIGDPIEEDPSELSMIGTSSQLSMIGLTFASTTPKETPKETPEVPRSKSTAPKDLENYRPSKYNYKPVASPRYFQVERGGEGNCMMLSMQWALKELGIEHDVEKIRGKMADKVNKDFIVRFLFLEDSTECDKSISCPNELKSLMSENKTKENYRIMDLTKQIQIYKDYVKRDGTWGDDYYKTLFTNAYDIKPLILMDSRTDGIIGNLLTDIDDTHDYIILYYTGGMHYQQGFFERDDGTKISAFTRNDEDIIDEIKTHDKKLKRKTGGSKGDKNSKKIIHIGGRFDEDTKVIILEKPINVSRILKYNDSKIKSAERYISATGQEYIKYEIYEQDLQEDKFISGKIDKIHADNLDAKIKENDERIFKNYEDGDIIPGWDIQGKKKDLIYYKDAFRALTEKPTRENITNQTKLKLVEEGDIDSKNTKIYKNDKWENIPEGEYILDPIRGKFMKAINNGQGKLNLEEQDDTTLLKNWIEDPERIKNKTNKQLEIWERDTKFVLDNKGLDAPKVDPNIKRGHDDLSKTADELIAQINFLLTVETLDEWNKKFVNVSSKAALELDKQNEVTIAFNKRRASLSKTADELIAEIDKITTEQALDDWWPEIMNEASRDALVKNIWIPTRIPGWDDSSFMVRDHIRVKDAYDSHRVKLNRTAVELMAEISKITTEQALNDWDEDPINVSTRTILVDPNNVTQAIITRRALILDTAVLLGGKKKIVKKTKNVRNHKGIVQIGGKIGKLRKGYKYSGKKLKSGIPQIVKVIRKKMN